MIRLSHSGGLYSLEWDPARVESGPEKVCIRHGLLAVRPACRGNIRYTGPLLAIRLALRRIPQGLVLVEPCAEAAMRAEVSSRARKARSLRARLKDLPFPLMPHQRAGVAFLHSRPQALLAFQPGTGKTATALLAAPEEAPILVVAPKVGLGVWRAEAALWRPDLNVVTPPKFCWPEPGQLVAVNYEKLKKLNGFCRHNTVVVYDEAHALKNLKSQRSKFAHLVRDQVINRDGCIWLLTGTPMLQRPDELEAVLEAARLRDAAYGSRTGFLQCFNGSPDRWGGIYWGQPTPEARTNLETVAMIVRREDVLKDLPLCRWQDVAVDVDAETMALCEKFMAHLRELGMTVEDAIATVMGTRKSALNMSLVATVRAALAVAKIPHLLQLVEDFEHDEEPLVVFSCHRRPVDLLAIRPGWSAIHGGVSAAGREKAVQAFQEGTLKGLAVTIQSGGTAITLTRGAHAVFVDRSWVPAENSQAEQRLSRKGQTRGVLIQTLVAAHNLDMRVADVLASKQRLVNAVLG